MTGMTVVLGRMIRSRSHSRRARGVLAGTLSALAAACLAQPAFAADSIYWTDPAAGKIRVGNLDGSGSPVTLFSAETTPNGVAIDPAAGKIYWADSNAGTIRVGNLDGSGSPATLFSGQGSPIGVAIDPAARKIYWADNANNTIRVGNLDGSGSAATLFGGEGTPQSVTVEPVGAKLYWASTGSGEIRVANQDGSGTPSNLFMGQNSPVGLAIYLAKGRIYWGNGSGDIVTGSLDGNGSANLFIGEGFASGIALDAPAGKIYWADFTRGTIRVGNLDGSGSPSSLFMGESAPSFLAILRSPAGQGAPQVSGGATVGSMLACAHGLWASNDLSALLYQFPRTMSYQWSVGGHAIAGATFPTFTPSLPGSYACSVAASNAAGSTTQTSVSHAVAATRATISMLRETNRVFALARGSTPVTGQTAAKRHPRGTVFSLVLDQPATVKIVIQASTAGRRVGRKCRGSSPGLRHKPRCTRTTVIAALTRSAHPGLNKLKFTGRIGGKALKPGHYQAVFTAVDGAGASRPQTLSFTILRR